MNTNILNYFNNFINNQLEREKILVAQQIIYLYLSQLIYKNSFQNFKEINKELDNSYEGLKNSEDFNIMINNSESCSEKNEGQKKFIYKKEKCEKEYDYKFLIEKHGDSNILLNKYKCEQEGCEKSYRSKENLNLHIKNKHLGIKPYQCKFCLLKFSHRNGN